MDCYRLILHMYSVCTVFIVWIYVVYRAIHTNTVHLVKVYTQYSSIHIGGHINIYTIDTYYAYRFI